MYYNKSSKVPIIILSFYFNQAGPAGSRWSEKKAGSFSNVHSTRKM